MRIIFFIKTLEKYFLWYNRKRNQLKDRREVTNWMRLLVLIMAGPSLIWSLNEKGGARLTLKVKTSVDILTRYCNSSSITKQVQSQESLSGVAISTAGVVDSRDRSYDCRPTIPGYTGTPLASDSLVCLAVRERSLFGWNTGGQSNRPTGPAICFTLGTECRREPLFRWTTANRWATWPEGWLAIGKQPFRISLNNCGIVDKQLNDGEI